MKVTAASNVDAGPQSRSNARPDGPDAIIDYVPCQQKEVAMVRSHRLPSTGFRMRFTGGLGSRALRRPDPRLRPAIEIGWVIDRISAGLAEHRPAADHRQLCKPLPRARETITIGDVGSGVGAAQITVAARVLGLCVAHRSPRTHTPGHSGTLREVMLNESKPTKNWHETPTKF